jgi:hypothetical protein
VALLALPAWAAKPAQEGLVYGEADGQKLTMDYYAPPGAGLHRPRESMPNPVGQALACAGL